MISGPDPGPTPTGPGFRLRPLTFSELLDEAFRIYRRHFSKYAAISLALAAPSVAIDLVSGGFRAGSVYGAALFKLVGFTGGPGLRGTGLDRLSEFDPLWLIPAVLLVLLLLPFTAGAMIRLTTEIAMGADASVASVTRVVLARFWGLYGVRVVATVVPIAVALLIVTFPLAIWIAVRWTVAVPALMAEGVGPMEALRRSWGLVRERWWQVAGILVVLTVLVTIAAGAVSLVVGLLNFAIPSADARLALNLITNRTAAALLAPIVPIAVTLIYLDLRVRKEGLDLQLLAMQAGAPVSGP